MSAPPGWHLQPDGRERFWDGQQWTEQFRAPAMSDPTAPPPAPSWATGDATSASPTEDVADAPPAPGATPDQTQALGVDQTQQLPAVPPASTPYGGPVHGSSPYGDPAASAGAPAYPPQAVGPQPTYQTPGVPATGYGSAGDTGAGWQPPQKSGGSGLLKGCLIAVVVGLIVLAGVVVAGIFFFNRAVDEVNDAIPSFSLPSDFPSDLPSDLPTDGLAQDIDITVGQGFDLPRAQVEDGWSLEDRGAAGFNAVQVKDMKATLGDTGGVPLFFTLSFESPDGQTVETPCTASGESGQTVDVQCVPLLGDVEDAREGKVATAF